MSNRYLTYGSVCSGIEAATVAWDKLGLRPAWFSEIDAFPSAVLDHHYPNVPNLGDMTKISARIASGEIEAPDVLVGGTPCQAFSVAGARQSLDDDRGQLTLEFVRLANEIDKTSDQPCIIVWENVPGVLNTKDNAFGCFLAALAGESDQLQPNGGRWSNAGAVFGPQRAIAWRTLDAQYFGVAQRRRRVFVVASARKGFNPHEVLFEWEGVRRDIAPSRSQGKEATRNAGAGFTASSFGGYREGVGTIRASGGDLGGSSETLAVVSEPIGATVSGKEVFPTLAASMGSKLWLGNQEAFSGDYFISQPRVVHGTQDPIFNENLAHPLGRNSGQENAVFGIPGNWIGRAPENGGNATEPMHDIAPCQTKTDRHGVASGTVRRLTPTECERLQGFPDNYTRIPWRKKPAEDCPDGPRYMALGNSMAVPCMRWIGERMVKVLNGSFSDPVQICTEADHHVEDQAELSFEV